MNPAEKPRVRIANAVGQKSLYPLLRLCWPKALDRQFRFKGGFHLWRDFVPDPSAASSLHLDNGGIQHLVGKRSKLAPVVRIEGLFWHI